MTFDSRAFATPVLLALFTGVLGYAFTLLPDEGYLPLIAGVLGVALVFGWLGKLVTEGRIVIAVAMLAIFAMMIGYAIKFPADARFLPWVIGIPGLLFCIGQLVLELSNGKSEAREPEVLRREVVMFAWFIAFIVGIVLFGFVYAGPVLVAAYLYFDWNERPMTVLISAVVAFAIFYGVFEWALELRLFAGLLGLPRL